MTTDAEARLQAAIDDLVKPDERRYAWLVLRPICAEFELRGMEKVSK